jgi:hypothetical protein
MDSSTFNIISSLKWQINSIRFMSLRDDGTTDDMAHNFVGPFKYLIDTDIAHISLDMVVLRQT